MSKIPSLLKLPPLHPGSPKDTIEYNSEHFKIRNKKSYTKLFTIFAFQKAHLLKIRRRLIQTSRASSDDTLKSFISIIPLINNIIDSHWGNLYESVTATSNYLSSTYGPDKFGAIKDFIDEIVTLISHMNRLLNQLRSPIAFKIYFSPENTNLNSNNLSKCSENDETVICRICEEKIRLDMAEEHTISCISAFQSHNKIAEINESLRLIQLELFNSYLQHSWPGEAEISSSQYIPILHLYLLIDKALATDPNLSESPEELRIIIDQFSLVSTVFYHTVASKLFEKVEKIVEQKEHFCLMNRTATEVLIRTRISGSPCVAEQLSQVTISDFSFIKRISRGAYASVYLAKKIQTDSIYAIKVLSKNSIHAKNQGRRVLTEKDILLQFTNPYIISFYYSIIGLNNLYIVMEYLPGGDLYSILHHLGVLDEQSAKTYTYQIVKALEFLRQCGIIHRDLKPDNILVTEEGSLKLIDFGLSYSGFVDRKLSCSEQSLTQSNSLVGTPDYTAPEIILNQLHTFTADYWSLGAMLYEFLTGTPPFHSTNEKQTFANIVSGDYEPLSPNEFSLEIIDLVSKLLKKDPKKRLGSNNILEILNHPWFKDLDLNNFEPPFIPVLSSPEDTAYFAERYSFIENDEASIREDLDYAKNSKGSNSGRRSSSNLSGHATEDESTNDDSDLNSFPSVSVTQLALENYHTANRTRRRSMSIAESTYKNNSQQKLIDSSILPNLQLCIRRRNSTNMTMINSNDVSLDDSFLTITQDGNKLNGSLSFNESDNLL